MSQRNVQPILCDLPFSVDTYDASTQDKLQFSSHAHKDHLIGIAMFPSNKAIFCTSMTKRLIIMKYPALKVPLRGGYTQDSVAMQFTKAPAPFPCDAATRAAIPCPVRRRRHRARRRSRRVACERAWSQPLPRGSHVPLPRSPELHNPSHGGLQAHTRCRSTGNRGDSVTVLE